MQRVRETHNEKWIERRTWLDTGQQETKDIGPARRLIQKRIKSLVNSASPPTLPPPLFSRVESLRLAIYLLAINTINSSRREWFKDRCGAATTQSESWDRATTFAFFHFAIATCKVITVVASYLLCTCFLFFSFFLLFIFSSTISVVTHTIPTNYLSVHGSLTHSIL